jgi:uracil phosphoribosyltransferase
MNIKVIDHPLVKHYLTYLRDKTSQPELFRAISKRLTTILVLEATRGLSINPKAVTTPMEDYAGAIIGEGITAVPILRAGLGMLDPVLEYFPSVSVGYIGLERDHTTAIASTYYSKLPPNMSDRLTLILDPMLATGGSATNAINSVKAAGARRIVMVCIIAAPEGVTELNKIHPDVDIVAAGLDRELNAQKYILPGLGDYGDRLYGTE